VIDAFQAGFPRSGPPSLPSGVSFSQPLPGYIVNSSEQPYIKYQRADYNGAHPNFLASDWAMGFIAPTVFYEGFENSPHFSSVWNKGSSITGGLTGGPSWVNPVGSRTLYSSGGSKNHKKGWSRVLPGLKPKQIAFRGGTIDASVISGYFLVGPNNTNVSDVAIFFYLNAGNMVIVSSTSSPTLMTYTSSKMYSVRLVLNWAAKTVNAYIDNQLKVVNLPFRSNSVNTIDRIDLYNYDGSGVFYDDIRFYD
jgi:hypothetical protein